MMTADEMLRNPGIRAQLEQQIRNMQRERSELGAPVTRRGAVNLIAWFRQASPEALRAMVEMTH